MSTKQSHHHRSARRIPFLAVFITLTMATSSVALATSGDAGPRPLTSPGASGEILPEVQAPQAGDAPNDAEREDSEYIETQSGIPDDGKRGWHNGFSLVVVEIQEDSGGDVAESMILDSGHAEIRFTGEVPTAALKLVQEFILGYPSVRVDMIPNVGYSESDLRAAVATAHYSVYSDEAVLDAVTWYDQDLRRIEITAAVGAQASSVDISVLADQASSAIRSELGHEVSSKLPSVVVELSSKSSIGGTESGSRHHGGESLSTCTSGFGTRDSSATSGTRRISTAHHCSNSQTDDGDSLTFSNGTQSTWWGDFQVHTGPDLETDDFYSGGVWSLETSLRDVSSVGSANTNQFLCRNGKSTFKHCQQVYKTYVCSSDYCNLVAMDTHTSTLGDSGGPVFWGNTAYGIHRGWATINGTKREVFSEALFIDEAIPGSGPHIATS